MFPRFFPLPPPGPLPFCPFHHSVVCRSGILGSPTTTTTRRCSGLCRCDRTRYFRQKSFKSFSCRRLRAEVDSELFIRCRLCAVHASCDRRSMLRSLFPSRSHYMQPPPRMPLQQPPSAAPSPRSIVSSIDVGERRNRKLLWVSDGRYIAASLLRLNRLALRRGYCCCILHRRNCEVYRARFRTLPLGNER